MQRRQLWFLNAVLAGCAILMATRLAGDWKRGNERYSRLDSRSGAAPTVPPVPVSGPSPISGSEVVAKNLFSRDRNNDRPQVAQTQAAAPLPVVIGTLRLGSGYEALMADAVEAAAHRFRRVKKGEQVGPYTVSEIRDEAVVVEFQGQKTVVNVYQSAQSVARAAQPEAPAAAQAPAASPVVESSAGPQPPYPAAAASGAQAAAAGAGSGASASDVKVTIEGNRRRYERQTMFGPSVWFEDIKK
jgi:hypothetical protein